MYCNQCGQTLPPTSRFCNSCGATVGANSNVNVAPQNAAPRPQNVASNYPPPPQGAPNYPPPQAAPNYPPQGAPNYPPMPHEQRDDLAPNEKVVFTLRPTLIFVFVRYIIATLILLATAVLMGVMSSFKPAWFTAPVSLTVIFIVGAIAFSVPVYRHILRRREVYTLTNYKLEMRYGLLSKTVRNIPLSKIQDVTVTASIWQRLISIGNIEIDSASEIGKIILDDIHHPERYSNLVLDELRRRN